MELQRVAAERGRTLSAVVDEFLAEGLGRSSAPKRRAATLRAFDMGEPLANVADRDQLWEAIERE